MEGPILLNGVKLINTATLRTETLFVLAYPVMCEQPFKEF